jgi:hypothetical protein
MDNVVGAVGGAGLMRAGFALGFYRGRERAAVNREDVPSQLVPPLVSWEVLRMALVPIDSLPSGAAVKPQAI